MSIGEKIKELRLEKGFSQLTLGKIIGVSQKAIDYWERNVNEPKASYIIAIVKTFDITFDDFFAEIN
ncbi:MAG: helix-turn-helix transcriptional regulator [Clostridia bacterium]|nr:helix-turn-helix transcriptional regulator [Clostridia bacterium]